MKESIYIGVDPSINSTGIAIRKGKDIYFYIIKNDDHILNKKGEKKDPLTKKEHLAEERNNIKYVMYDKWHSSNVGSSVDNERLKTLSLFNICEKLEDIVNSYIDDNTEVYACIEGVSYGSGGKTSAIYDLAGLNYLMRYTLAYKCNVKVLIVAPPGHVKKFATGNGNADKNLMITVFDSIMPGLDIPKKDDIADAYFMSRIAEVEKCDSV